MQTGTIDPVAKTFDIYNVAETQTSILLTNTQLSLTYRDETNQLIKLVKPVSQELGQYIYRRTITDPRAVSPGTALGPSQCTQAGLGGYLEPGSSGARSLMTADWAGNSQSKATFVDQDGEPRVAVLLPVVI